MGVRASMCHQITPRITDSHKKKRKRTGDEQEKTNSGWENLDIWGDRFAGAQHENEDQSWRTQKVSNQFPFEHTILWNHSYYDLCPVPFYSLLRQNESMWREITEHRHSRMLEQWKMDRVSTAVTSETLVDHLSVNSYRTHNLSGLCQVINYFTMLYKNRDSDPTRDFDPRMSKRSRIRRAISVPPLESGNEQSPAKCHSAPPALDVLSPTAVQQTLHAAENSHRNMNEATLGGTDQQLDGPCTVRDATGRTCPPAPYAIVVHDA